MDTFDLRWPHGTATLCTDGWRCRIVWRGVRGLGGSIENSALAKRRIADGLVFAPKLLEQLRSRGHGELAAEIEFLLPGEEAIEANVPAQPDPHPVAETAPTTPAATPAAPPAAPPEIRSKAPVSEVAEPKPAAVDASEPTVVSAAVAPAGAWLDQLTGDGNFESCGNRRAKTWLEATPGAFVKVPAAKGGAREWVVKFAEGNKFEYASAESFKGVLAYVEHKGVDLDDFMAHAAALAQTGESEVTDAIALWRTAHPQH